MRSISNNPIAQQNRKEVEQRASKQEATKKASSPYYQGSLSGGTSGVKVSGVSEYMTLVSRLENKLKQGVLNAGDLDQMLTALTQKILALSEKAKDKVKKLEEFQDLGIKDWKKMKQEFKKFLEDEEEREKVLSFLKSQAFIAAINNQPEKLLTYSPVAA